MTSLPSDDQSSIRWRGGEVEGGRWEGGGVGGRGGGGGEGGEGGERGERGEGGGVTSWGEGEAGRQGGTKQAWPIPG